MLRKMRESSTLKWRTQGCPHDWIVQEGVTYENGLFFPLIPAQHLSSAAAMQALHHNSISSSHTAARLLFQPQDSPITAMCQHKISTIRTIQALHTIVMHSVCFLRLCPAVAFSSQHEIPPISSTLTQYCTQGRFSSFFGGGRAVEKGF